ncbi:hypothetical protein Aab01nite_03440 [Paractinoplanes abujensis]|nr:hypothetical protein Aab01nite_03440 [Actinoplanes abujensis]
MPGAGAGAGAGRMVDKEILDYYRRGGERDGPAAGAGRLEFLRTWDVLVRTLPPAPTVVLDVGGATGSPRSRWPRRAIGSPVVDPVAEHAVVAGSLDGVEAVQGDARECCCWVRSITRSGGPIGSPRGWCGRVGWWWPRLSARSRRCSTVS